MKTALKFLIGFSFCLFFQNAISATIIPAGTLSSAHWTLAGSPYQIMGHIIVANNDSLVVDPGVVVEFQGKYKLFCNGKILANGTPSLPILFTVPVANRTTGWLGIRYDNTPVTNGQSSFRYCTIEYGRANIAGGNQGGAFYFNNFGNCIIANSVIRNCYAEYGGAISANYASPIFEQDSFYNNTAAHVGCILLGYSSSTFDSCSFRDGGITCSYSSVKISNSSFNKCAAAVASYSEPHIGYLEIVKNVFDSCSNGDGGAILLLNAQAKIEHNIFSHNTSGRAGGAICCTTQWVYPNSDKMFISNNLFFDNHNFNINLVSGGDPFGGGAISFANCSGKVINNTFVDNYSDSAGGAIFCGFGSSPSFYNNIIYNNTINSGVENIFIMDNLSDPNFYHNDLEGGYSAINTNGTPLVGANSNNIDSMPRFTNPAAGIYTLDSTSACIDSGTLVGISTLIPLLDLAGNPRNTGAAIDMGAYETVGKTSSVAKMNANPSIFIFPNPTNSYFEIKGLDLKDIESIVILDLIGKEVARFSNITNNNFEVSNLASGMLYLRINCRDGNFKNLRLIKN